MGAHVFISYSHADEGLRDELEVHLAMLKRQGMVDVWHDRRLVVGDRLDWTISEKLDQADIILLLVSPDFIASDYCYQIEKSRAIERHREGSARLISVILRPCDWKHTELSEFLVTPTDAKPITRWPDRDEAFHDVTTSIRQAIDALGAAPFPEVSHGNIEAEIATEAMDEPEAPIFPRSSNLRLKKEFTEADRESFLFDGFEYMAKFFQGSLEELETRNEGITTRYRRVDSDCFTATIYINGAKAAGGTIRVGGMFGQGITWLENDTGEANTHNESLSVGSDDQKLFFKPMGMAIGPQQPSPHLTQEGAAEFYWALLIEGLQGN
ncbi:TIR domain-containing protein [Maritimibacter sp. DP07]|uniref:TIR domain-containing protein n=1 Tax=Maritimibacter harenae TaxID=2606218 RepID=A0A845M9C8_9RHOB|nr:toll/interleukin-1 receptor domain-containing protein [Maritimibacter harenae]MZR14333.1 TIR domain-containing protein [Maritimibacter harenae]